jgi:uncharacterized membrane protein
MEARAKLLGHPIHQMLIVVPLGLLVGVIIFDLLYLMQGRADWANVSYRLIPVGIVSGLIAAVFGLADWTKIPPGSRARGVGVRHAVGNVVVLILYGISWLLRRDSVTEPSTVALVASFAGGALAAVTGWLGGELVDRLGVGVHPGAHVDAPSSLVSKTPGPE